MLARRWMFPVSSLVPRRRRSSLLPQSRAKPTQPSLLETSRPSHSTRREMGDHTWEILAGCVSGYLLCSLLLLLCPSILHRRKRPAFSATVIAHRGGAAEYIENTMQAFNNAVSVGADMLELDTQITRDGKVVVCHDNNLSRLTGKDVRVSELLYEELPPLRSPQLCMFTPSIVVSGSDTRIPLLEEVFQQFPNTPINLDVKEPDVNLRIQVESLIREYKREAITPWGNRSEAISSQLFKLNPDIPLIMSLRKVLLHAVVLWVGVLPFVPIKEAYYEIPSFSSMLGTFGHDFKWYHRVIGFLFDCLIGNRVLIFHYRRRGIACYSWVVNDETRLPLELARFDGVMTDRVSALARLVQHTTHNGKHH